jgi:hypothetical protein
MERLLAPLIPEEPELPSMAARSPPGTLLAAAWARTPTR